MLLVVAELAWAAVLSLPRTECLLVLGFVQVEGVAVVEHKNAQVLGTKALNSVLGHEHELAPGPAPALVD